MKSIAIVMASLGLVQLISSATAWSWPQPKLFLIYVCMALLCSSLQLKISGVNSPTLSANVPVILLGILRLNLPEAVIVGASGALAQGLVNRQTRSRWLHLALGVCVAASAIATADFVYRSLIPNSVQNPALRLLAASLALFFANTFPLALASRGHEQPRLGQYWKESYSWLVPYYLVSAAVASAADAAATNGVSLQTMLLVLPAIYVAYRYYRVQKSNLEMREKTAESTAALHLRAIEGLALAVEAKDSLNTRGHLCRVRVYALGVGQDFGLQGDDLEALQAAALLHDIGKLAVPEYILSKPGKLTPEEFAKMKVHPIVGAEIIEQVQFPYPVAPIVRAHHEKWDGSGYPFGLKGRDIPIGARILTAVDYFDALASDREYRRALPLDEAMKIVQAESGKALDPEVVRALGQRYRELERNAKAANEGGVTLSKNVSVERGSAPDAGLDLWALAGMPSGGVDVLNTIAAAGREQQMLLALTEGLGLSLDLNTILERVDSGLRLLIPCEAMAIFVPQGNSLVVVHSAGEQKAMISSEVRAGEGLIGWVAQNQQPIANGNPAVERGFQGDVESGLKAALAVPLKRSGGLAGVLAYYRRDRDSFSADDLRILTNVAPRIGTAIENALKVKELQERASMDAATGLPTLRAMTQALDLELIRAQRQSQGLAVIFARFSGLHSLPPETPDLDMVHGLRDAAQLLRNGCREYDFVARVGEDTFAVIYPGMKRDALGHKVEKLNAAAFSVFPQMIENGSIRFGIGWAHYPEDAATSKLLLAIAEGRSEIQANSLTENLLALHAQNRKQTEAPPAEEAQSGGKVSTDFIATERDKQSTTPEANSG
jgi:diguanylate cyclase (GGDEF)-like protein/putative nucleotidyltransferase with HDIG domain